VIQRRLPTDSTDAGARPGNRRPRIQVSADNFYSLLSTDRVLGHDLVPCTWGPV
jgi:hypothetical protein